jgi:hypothetical protein
VGDAVTSADLTWEQAMALANTMAGLYGSWGQVRVSKIEGSWRVLVSHR